MRLSKQYRQLLLLFAIYSVIILIAEIIYHKAYVSIQVDCLDLNYQQAYFSIYEKKKMLIYILPIAFILIRVLGGGICMYLGSFFSGERPQSNISDFFSIVLKAQWILVLKEIIRVVYFIVTNGEHLNKILANYTSMGNPIVKRLFRDVSIYTYISNLFESINIIELLYWFFIAWGVSKTFSKSLGQSYMFVLKTYGLGYLLFQICMVFILFLLQ